MENNTSHEMEYLVYLHYETVITLQKNSLEHDTLETALPNLCHTLLRKILAITGYNFGIYSFVNYKMSEFDMMPVIRGEVPSFDPSFIRFRHWDQSNCIPVLPQEVFRLPYYPLKFDHVLTRFLEREHLIEEDLDTKEFEEFLAPFKDASACCPGETAKEQIRYLQNVMSSLNNSEGEKTYASIKYRMDGYYLGHLFLWGKSDKVYDTRFINQNYDRIELWGSTLLSILQTRYNIQQSVYLPSFARSENRNAFLLYADIREFAAVSEIARFTGRSSYINEFMSSLADQFVAIINKCGGRLENIRGDSFLAIFGEYDINPLRVCYSVIKAAKMMYEAFTKMIGKVYDSEYERQFNEAIDIDLGISINYGNVYFAYLGKAPNVTYVAIGDHANFSARLGNEASIYDNEMIPPRKRAPILISQTVFSILKTKINENGLETEAYQNFFKEFTPNHGRGRTSTVRFGSDPIRLKVKGKGHPCIAYELWPEKFLDDTFKQYVERN